MKSAFNFKAKVWVYDGPAPWHFVNVDKKVSEKIKKSKEGKLRRGWGSVRVSATVGKTTWKTSIFPDKGVNYLLPIKADVRKREGIGEGDSVKVALAVAT